MADAAARILVHDIDQVDDVPGAVADDVARRATRGRDEFAVHDQQAVVGATATLELAPTDAEALALAKAAGTLSLVLRSYADTAGPSGRVQNQPRARATPQTTSIRVYRGGEAETVTVQ